MTGRENEAPPPGPPVVPRVTGYLAKPCDLADLLACVAQYRPSHE
jgi:hypothetical protein